MKVMLGLLTQRLVLGWRWVGGGRGMWCRNAERERARGMSYNHITDLVHSVMAVVDGWGCLQDGGVGGQVGD